MDFVQKDNDGEITDFGRMPISQPVTVENTHTLLITNKAENPVDFLYPSAWLDNGLTAAPSEEAALTRLTAKDGQPVQVLNLDKQYVSYFRIEGENTASAFGYAVRDGRNAITAYRFGSDGRFDIPAGGMFTFAPNKNTTAALYYPAEWDGELLQFSLATERPLHQITLKPGERVTFQNRTRGRDARDFELHNNSMASNASYFIRVGRDNSRIGVNEQPGNGNIPVPSETSVTVIAAPGGDLEIWMPLEWAVLLIR
jgi:hypothetical protein